MRTVEHAVRIVCSFCKLRASTCSM